MLILKMAFNSRPQQSSGVVSRDLFTPEGVRSLSVERLVVRPTPDQTDVSP